MLSCQGVKMMPPDIFACRRQTIHRPVRPRKGSNARKRGVVCAVRTIPVLWRWQFSRSETAVLKYRPATSFTGTAARRSLRVALQHRSSSNRVTCSISNTGTVSTFQSKFPWLTKHVFASKFECRLRVYLAYTWYTVVVLYIPLLVFTLISAFE